MGRGQVYIEHHTMTLGTQMQYVHPLHHGGMAFGFYPIYEASKKNQNNGMSVSAQLNEAALQKSDSTPSLEKSVESTREISSETTIPDAASITAFMNQVTGLVQII